MIRWYTTIARYRAIFYKIIISRSMLTLTYGMNGHMDDVQWPDYHCI